MDVGKCHRSNKPTCCEQQPRHRWLFQIPMPMPVTGLAVGRSAYDTCCQRNIPLFSPPLPFHARPDSFPTQKVRSLYFVRFSSSSQTIELYAELLVIEVMRSISPVLACLHGWACTQSRVWTLFGHSSTSSLVGKPSDCTFRS